MTPQLKQKVSEAKAKLLVDYPYFGTLASRLELKPNDNIQAYLSDGVRFEYNDEYLLALNRDELSFALSNGAMHAALAYENRQKGRMSWLWQLATDHAINTMLVANGLEAPMEILPDPRFEGMYAEEIYAILKDEIQNEDFDDNEENVTGFNEENKRQQEQMKNAEGDHDPDKKRERMEVENQEQKKLIAQEEMFEQFANEALEKIKLHGDLPLDIERFFTIVDSSKVDWRKELYRAIDRHYHDNYRMMPPSKKLLYSGIYLPSLYSDTLRLTIAIDSSGSVDETLLSLFLSEVEAILIHFPNYVIDLIVCDAKIQSYRQILSGERLDVEIKGGGGTDFRPVFTLIDESLDAPSLLLYFSDTKGTFPEREPFYEVVWISEESSELPFGEQLLIEKDML
ncbi:MAG: VWA-like domain-containing protein [Helicobacteraceae bacterium]|jgi:predicted metal-dependent peptidase|nr:VWA-like domain-containing protein [Helicobacteraceae bacterium]